jgi:hypothetical protein
MRMGAGSAAAAEAVVAPAGAAALAPADVLARLVSASV